MQTIINFLLLNQRERHLVSEMQNFMSRMESKLYAIKKFVISFDFYGIKINALITSVI